MINGSKHSKRAKVIPYRQVTKPLNIQCRICFEGDSSENPLISPCECNGSVRYIHEKCLKEWILSQTPNPSTFNCDLCKYPVKMEIKVNKTISCTQLETIKCKILTLLTIILAFSSIITLVLMYILDIDASMKTSITAKMYLAAIALACFSADMAFIVILYRSIKSECLDSVVQSWKIFPKEGENDLTWVTDICTKQQISGHVSEPGLTESRKSTLFCTERVVLHRWFGEDGGVTEESPSRMVEL